MRRIQHHATQRLAEARQSFHSAKAIISDIDGVLLLNGCVLPGTAQLAQCKPLALVSNNSTHSAAELCAFFVQAGVEVRPEQFFLAGEAAVATLAAALPGAAVVALGTPSITQMMREKGLKPLRASAWRQADAVLLCRDTALTYERLEAAANAALAGIPVYCANPDITHPAQVGVHLETGCLLAALQAVAPSMRLTVVGKPLPDILLRATRFLQTEPEQALFLGDNPHTDARCAAAVGMAFLRIDTCHGPRVEELTTEGRSPR